MEKQIENEEIERMTGGIFHLVWKNKYRLHWDLHENIHEGGIIRLPPDFRPETGDPGKTVDSIRIKLSDGIKTADEAKEYLERIIEFFEKSA